MIGSGETMETPYHYTTVDWMDPDPQYQGPYVAPFLQTEHGPIVAGSLIEVR